MIVKELMTGDVSPVAMFLFFVQTLICCSILISHEVVSDMMHAEEREPSFACRGWRIISERCDLSGKLLWLRVAARSQVHTNTSSRPAARFLQPLSFQQTEFQCEPPPLQRLTRGIEKAGKGGSPVETL